MSCDSLGVSENQMTERVEIIGYDVEAVEEWIKDNTEGLEPPFDWVQLEGGHSNLTYALTDLKGNRAVVRRPPMGELLPKAHDMGREFSIISGLGPTAVPVPTVGSKIVSPSFVNCWIAHLYPDQCPGQMCLSNPPSGFTSGK